MGNHTATRARGRASGAGEPKAKTARPAKKASADDETKALRAARAAPTGPTGPTPREREAESRARAAESRATAAERRTAQLERQLATLQAQHDALKARVAGAGAAAGPRSRAAKNPEAPVVAKRTTELAARNVSLFHNDIHQLRAMRDMYGLDQFKRAITPRSMGALRDFVTAVQQEHPGTAPRSLSRKADMVDYLYEQMSTEGEMSNE